MKNSIKNFGIFLLYLFFEPIESLFQKETIKRIIKPFRKPQFYLQGLIIASLVHAYLKNTITALVILIFIELFVAIKEWKDRRWVGWWRKKKGYSKNNRKVYKDLSS